MSHQFQDIMPEGAYLKNLPFASIKKKSFDTSWYKIEEKFYTNFSTLNRESSSQSHQKQTIFAA